MDFTANNSFLKVVMAFEIYDGNNVKGSVRNGTSLRKIEYTDGRRPVSY